MSDTNIPAAAPAPAPAPGPAPAPSLNEAALFLMAALVGNPSNAGLEPQEFADWAFDLADAFILESARRRLGDTLDHREEDARD